MLGVALGYNIYHVAIHNDFKVEDIAKSLWRSNPTYPTTFKSYQKLDRSWAQRMIDISLAA
eukprot:8451945-Karenia_brevis.AAC.1